jgi:hypothetical protein
VQKELKVKALTKSLILLILIKPSCLKTQSFNLNEIRLNSKNLQDDPGLNNLISLI